MSDTSTSLFRNEARSEWVRLRTLINLRWLAIMGQSVAVIIAEFYLNIQLDAGLCALAIGASVILNLVTSFILPSTRRLSKTETSLMLLFDILQLVFLLYLTGGLDNPFSLLILAPVTISATALTMNATLFLGVVAISLATMLLKYKIPLTTATGEVLSLPQLFQLGNWIALILGIVFLASYARRVTVESFSMSQALAATQMALDREHELTMLGGVVAAAAHEMGTPLATIKLASSELHDELADHPDLQNDAALIHQQADRLSAILRDMGRTGKDDLHLKSTPILSLVAEAAEPHQNRGKEIVFLANGRPADAFIGRIPTVHRQPQIIHGLRNLIQNAVDFSAANVWVNATWTDKTIRILVADDGKGIAPDLLSRIGDPFVARRSNRHSKRGTERPEYEGMGLGLFIAKTLLERSGATLIFANADASTEPLTESNLRSKLMVRATGAMISISWPRDKLENQSTALGPNERVES